MTYLYLLKIIKKNEVKGICDVASVISLNACHLNRAAQQQYKNVHLNFKLTNRPFEERIQIFSGHGKNARES